VGFGHNRTLPFASVPFVVEDNPVVGFTEFERRQEPVSAARLSRSSPDGVEVTIVVAPFLFPLSTVRLACHWERERRKC
jgi:hypothetical protein